MNYKEVDVADNIHVLDMFLRDMHDLDSQLAAPMLKCQTNASSSIAKFMNNEERTKSDQMYITTSSKPSKKKMQSWLRRKEELNTLRQQIQELDTRVAFLKLQQEKHRIQLNLSLEAYAELKSWEAAAILEKERRQVAQGENKELKIKVRTYAQLLSSLQSAVSAAALQTQLSNSASPSMYRVLMEFPEERQRIIVSNLNDLEARLDQRFQEFPTGFAELYQDLVSADTTSFQMRSNYGEDASVMEYKWSQVLPFDELTTSNTVWEIVEGVESPQKLVSRIVRRSENASAVDSRYVLAVNHHDAVTVDSQCVVKRFIVPGSFIILAESSSIYRGVSGTWSNSTQESVWFAARRPPLEVKNHMPAQASGCQMKAVVRSESGQQYPSRDLMVDSVKELIDSQHQFLENVLWDTIRISGK